MARTQAAHARSSAPVTTLATEPDPETEPEPDEEPEAEASRAGQEETGQKGQNLPLFDGIRRNEVEYILVSRSEPTLEQGSLGRISPDATEFDISDRWGGGKYVLTARDANNRLTPKGRRTIYIAGDPLFQSETNRQKWIRMQGGAVAPPAPAQLAPPAQPVQHAPSITELLTIITTITTQSQQAAAAAQAAQMEQIRAHQAARDAEIARTEERRRKEDQDREERLRKDQREYEQRRAEDDRARQDRDREHQRALLDMVKTTGAAPAANSAETLNTFIAGIKMAIDLGGGGRGGGDTDDEEDTGPSPGDPVVAAITKLGDVAQEFLGKKMGPVGGAAAEKQGGQNGAGAGAGNSVENGPEKATHGETPNSVTLQGAIAEKAKLFISSMQSAGKDPESVLGAAFDTMVTAEKRKKANGNGSPAPGSWPPPAARVIDAVPADGPKDPPAAS